MSPRPLEYVTLVRDSSGHALPWAIYRRRAGDGVGAVVKRTNGTYTDALGRAERLAAALDLPLYAGRQVSP